MKSSVVYYGNTTTCCALSVQPIESPLIINDEVRPEKKTVRAWINA